jgi:anaerobic selenocysteine-containing dehydrogenase
MFRNWDTPQDVFQLLKRLSAGQPCDFSGIASYDMFDRCGGIQWPFTATTEPTRSQSERRLFENGQFYHADGRARFIFEEPRPLPEQSNDRFPFVLLTGRGTAAQWHTQTRTGKSAVLRKLYPEEVYIEINPVDAQLLHIRSGDWITVASQRGRLRARAFLTSVVQSGQLFIPMHYDVTNLLTDAVFDPYSYQPAYKACAVRIETEI